MADLLIDAHWLLEEARDLLTRDGWDPEPKGAHDYGCRYTGWDAAGAVYAAARFIDQEDGTLRDAVSERDFDRWRECGKAFRALCRAIGLDIVRHENGEAARIRVSRWSDGAPGRDVVLAAFDIAIARTAPVTTAAEVA